MIFSSLPPVVRAVKFTGKQEKLQVFHANFFHKLEWIWLKLKSDIIEASDRLSSGRSSWNAACLIFEHLYGDFLKKSAVSGENKSFSAKNRKSYKNSSLIIAIFFKEKNFFFTAVVAKICGRSVVKIIFSALLTAVLTLFFRQIPDPSALFDIRVTARVPEICSDKKQRMSQEIRLLYFISIQYGRNNRQKQYFFFKNTIPGSPVIRLIWFHTRSYMIPCDHNVIRFLESMLRHVGFVWLLSSHKKVSYNFLGIAQGSNKNIKPKNCLNFILGRIQNIFESYMRSYMVHNTSTDDGKFPYNVCSGH